MTRPILPILLLLAACSPAAEERNDAESTAAGNLSNQSEPAGAEKQQAEVPSLAGQWTVTALNGAPLTQIFTMNANVTGDRFTIQSDCVSMIWNYTQNGNALTVTPASTVECARGRTTNEEQVERMMEGVNMALFSDDGREVQLSGFRGTISMTRR